jgi:hypothetical protein
MPGESFTVTGSGCPPTGAFPADNPVRLRLTPPGGGNDWYPSILDGGDVGVISTAAGIAGEAGAGAIPAPDGTFQVSITIPTAEDAGLPVSPAGEYDAPAGEYTVRGLCLTVLEPGDYQGFTRESYDASFAETAGITVQAPPTTVPPPGDPDPRPRVQPAFTG